MCNQLTVKLRMKNTYHVPQRLFMARLLTWTPAVGLFLVIFSSAYELTDNGWRFARRRTVWASWIRRWIKHFGYCDLRLPVKERTYFARKRRQGPLGFHCDSIFLCSVWRPQNSALKLFSREGFSYTYRMPACAVSMVFQVAPGSFTQWYFAREVWICFNGRKRSCRGGRYSWAAHEHSYSAQLICLLTSYAFEVLNQTQMLT